MRRGAPLVLALSLALCALSTHAQDTTPAPSEPFVHRPALLACLPGSLDALLVYVPRGVELLDPVDGSTRTLRDTFLLVPSDGPARPSGLDRARATALGIPGDGAFARVRLGNRDTRGCTVPAVAVSSLRRLDASRALPLDVGATLATLLAAYAPGTPSRTALEARALATAAASPGTPVGTPELVLGVRWDRTTRRLTVLVAARSLRVETSEAPNPDAHAGSTWCSAPRGADCAPRCIPPRLLTTRQSAGEAGTTYVYAADGTELSRTDADGTIRLGQAVRPTGYCGR